uniref:Chemokine interleukin-8-like domain-containing protein n=1 Tax=Gopherus agassizii TaxID=38772 RepID=A0A452IMR2_9SAUR
SSPNPCTVLLILWFCSMLPVAGLPMESLLTNQRCRCRKQTSDVISASKIRFIEVIPQGIQCRRKEIILTLKNTQKVCVYPNAPWIQLLLRKLTQRYCMCIS